MENLQTFSENSLIEETLPNTNESSSSNTETNTVNSSVNSSEPNENNQVGPYPILNIDPVPPPPAITIDELLSLKEVIQKKEDQDRVICTQIVLPYGVLKEKLYDWACAGFPSAYEISKIIIFPPNKCSDGVTRNMNDYIFFLSGKRIHEHIQLIQEQLSGIQVGASVVEGQYIQILVNKINS